MIGLRRPLVSRQESVSRLNAAIEREGILSTRSHCFDAPQAQPLFLERQHWSARPLVGEELGQRSAADSAVSRPICLARSPRFACT